MDFKFTVVGDPKPNPAFAELNEIVIDRLIVWAKRQKQLKKKGK